MHVGELDYRLQQTRAFARTRRPNDQDPGLLFEELTQTDGIGTTPFVAFVRQRQRGQPTYCATRRVCHHGLNVGFEPRRRVVHESLLHNLRRHPKARRADRCTQDRQKNPDA